MTQVVAPAAPAASRPRVGRSSLIIAALALIAAGMALNWNWLVAVGAAPLILSLAPCAAMCALGLCMMRGSKSCGSKTGPATPPGSTTD